jgi:phospholipid N-methyltransferase
MWQDVRIFFGEFCRRHYTTGAIVPSGRFLAAALARYVAEPGCGGRRILEVGPGTGAVTRRIIAVMRPEDHLDLVEVNERFVARLQVLFQTDPLFRRVAARSRVLHCPVETLDGQGQYDLIVSGLPLNNFPPETVENILGVMSRLLKPGGTISFFQYIALRAMRMAVSGRSQRRRLRGVRDAIHKLLDGGEVRRDWIWLNVPPAWVHHVRLAQPSQPHYTCQ